MNFFPNSVYSVISPEGCASILWKDSSKASDAADALKLTADDLYSFDIVEKVIDEKDKSAEEICSDLKNYLVEELKKKQVQKHYLKQKDLKKFMCVLMMIQ